MDHPVQTDFLRWIVLLPLLGAAVNGLLGARIQERAGKETVAIIACAPVTLSFLLSLWAFGRLLFLDAEGRFLIDRFYSWIPLGSFQVDVAFWVDPLSAIMILVVSGIGGLIHFYSIGYMHEDRSLWRYFAYLNLFTFSMLLLVTADNLLLMFVGWEGVGLCSWALIGFWFHDHANTRAGNKAFIVNRIGDFGFVLGVFLLFWSLTGHGHGTLAFREIGEHAPLLAGMDLWGVSVATLVTAPVVRRRHRQVGAAPAPRLAAGRHAGPDPGERADPRGHHGDGRGLHDRAAQRALLRGPGDPECHRGGGRGHGASSPPPSP